MKKILSRILDIDVLGNALVWRQQGRSLQHQTEVNNEKYHNTIGV